MASQSGSEEGRAAQGGQEWQRATGDLTRMDLDAICRRLRISGYSKHSKKDELLAWLFKQHRAAVLRDLQPSMWVRLASVRSALLASFSVLGSLVSLLAWAQCGATRPASIDTTEVGDSVTIGVIVPLTGPSEYYGVRCLNGIKLAVDDYNANPDVVRRVKLSVRDDRGDPDTSRLLVSELVGEGAAAILGEVSEK